MLKKNGHHPDGRQQQQKGTTNMVEIPGTENSLSAENSRDASNRRGANNGGKTP
jgi:hypothetical protein